MSLICKYSFDVAEETLIFSNFGMNFKITLAVSKNFVFDHCKNSTFDTCTAIIRFHMHYIHIYIHIYIIYIHYIYIYTWIERYNLLENIQYLSQIPQKFLKTNTLVKSLVLVYNIRNVFFKIAAYVWIDLKKQTENTSCL